GVLAELVPEPGADGGPGVVELVGVQGRPRPSRGRASMDRRGRPPGGGWAAGPVSGAECTQPPRPGRRDQTAYLANRGKRLRGGCNSVCTGLCIARADPAPPILARP